MAESEEELKNLLMKVKEESEKLALKSSAFRKLRSWHLVPSLRANRWGNNGNSDRLYFGVPQIKSVTVYTVSQSICHEVMGPDAIILAF